MRSARLPASCNLDRLHAKVGGEVECLFKIELGDRVRVQANLHYAVRGAESSHSMVRGPGCQSKDGARK